MAQLHSYSLTYCCACRVTIPDVVEPRPFLSFTCVSVLPERSLCLGFLSFFLYS